MALDDVLQRFRRIWAPPGGPAGVAAVPVDLEVELAQELSTVFAALQAVERESAEILEAAQDQAEAIRAKAGGEVARVSAAAQARAQQERVRAADEQSSTARRAAAARLRRARREAARIRRVAAEREPQLVAEVVESIRSAPVAAAAGGERVVAGLGSR